MTTLTIPLPAAAGSELFMGKHTGLGSQSVEAPAAIHVRAAGNSHGVETEMVERRWETSHFNVFVKIAEQQENLARSTQVLVAHDVSVIEAALQTVFDSSGEAPCESPQQAALGRKPSPECPAAAKKQPGTSQNKGKIV